MRKSWEAGGAMLAGTALVLTGCGNKNGSPDQGTKASHPVTQSARSTPSTLEGQSMRVGYDLSYPQAAGPYPADGAYRIVGLNGTLANNFNPYFKRQYQWAEQAPGTQDIPAASMYVHVSNAGAKLAAKWPKSGSTPYGECHGATDRACSYLYGVQFALGDLEAARKVTVTPKFVWLDVEKGYSWQPQPELNQAVAEGMTDTFKKADIEVGVYSTADDMQTLMGEVPTDSPLHGLPNWLRGAQDAADARRLCARGGFTGRAIMAQVAGELNATGIDNNYMC